ncbi:MAG TPA: TonB-dependent receptor [Gemmatimonadaceae bacterium]|nr:TonB-dependent receptor [Gemmatimonadaceae bacterium]
MAPRALVASLILLLGTFAPSTLDAQSTAILAGRVTLDGTPAADVAVFLAGTTRGTVTGDDGRYQIAGIAPGSYIVVTQRIGAATQRSPLTIAEGERATLDVGLVTATTLLTPMTVSATRELRRRDEGSATIDVMDGAELRRSHASHPSGVMNRIPGVHVSELSGVGHSMSMRQPITTKPMYLYLEDGIPTRATGFFNHNALYEVNIPQAAGIEVLKGPGTALYGSDAIGGVVNVLTRPAPLTPGLEASLEGGAYGYGRVLLSGGGTRAGDGLRADLNLTRSENWKQQSPFERQSGTVRWDHTASSGWTARTVVTGSHVDQQDVPPLSTALFDTSRALNLAPIAYRRVKALRVSSAIEREQGAGLWSVTPYARYDDMELLPSWQLTYDPQTWDTKNTSAGLLTKYRRDFAPWRARVIAGADAEVSPGSFLAQRAVVTRTGAARAFTSYTAGETQYDYDVTYRSASPYVHTEASPFSRQGALLGALRVDAGLRLDFSGYSYTSRLAPLDTGAHRRPANTTRAYAHLSPKLGATLTLDSATSVFASYRHGFRAPSQGQLFQQNSAANTVDLAPVKVDAFEVGLRGRFGWRATWQLSAYDMLVRDDIITYVTASNTREANNAGRTRHRGIEAGASAALTSALRVDASWSVSRQTYVEWTPQSATAMTAAVSYSGNLIENAPRDLGSVFLAWSPTALRGGRLALEWSHTGGYATDPANTHAYAGYELLNMYASGSISARTELFGRVTNLANAAYAELVTYDSFQKDQITPGAPKSLYVGLKTSW